MIFDAGYLMPKFLSQNLHNNIKSMDFPSSFPRSSSSSTTSTLPSATYDVFLSFRGADTRHGFTDHLYSSLVTAGIFVFRDDDSLRRGDELSSVLLKAIEESKMSIVVLSQNYANSRWCLDELVKILDRKRTNRQKVFPIFYGVDPSEVRHQRGIIAEAFRKHEVRYGLKKVQEWREALVEVANLAGFYVQKMGSESRAIDEVVRVVVSQINPKKLFTAEHPVGLDSRFKEAYSLLRVKSRDVRLIGIYGMGGKGKTVIAKALYNEILHNFDSSCFLANVREVSGQANGLVYLQEQLLSELLMMKDVKVGTVDRGINMIKERFGRKKVLIVVDDLDKLSQLNALAGVHNWFGPGSRIIITTREEHLLNLVQVDARYEARELNYAESLELFSWHAFKEPVPPELYAQESDRIIAYSGGLALALQVLGSYLFKRPLQAWISAIDKLRKFPPNQIQEKLKISYDGLDDDELREIFLDVACFFVGMDKDYVTEALNGCGFSAEIGIRVLKDRCLLLPDNRKNELRMHDLLRDMGREIIRQSFPKNPRKRSRLWVHDDVLDVLGRNKGTEATEGISIVSPVEEEIHLHTESIARMHKLRLLQMANVHLNGGFEYLPQNIRLLCWQGCPLKYLPWEDLHMVHLVVLDMQHSKLRRAWQGIQFLGSLKILNLSYSKCLETTPNFMTVPRLVTLILEGCTCLLGLHPTIGSLSRLLFLNLKDCEKITNIPSEICSLRSLGYLNLNGCSNLQALPVNLGCIDSLRELYADETAIAELPPSIGLLKNLTSLSLEGCNKRLWISPESPHDDAVRFLPHSISQLTVLQRFNLRNCNLSDEDIPFDIGSLSSLTVLDIAGNSLTSLPSSFTQLTNLESLVLDDWSILESLGELPSNLKTLMAENRGSSSEISTYRQNPDGYVD